MSPPLATTHVIETIQGVLAPHIGESMARAATRAQIEALAITGETIDPALAAELLRRVGRGLTVFVGSAQTLRLLADIAAVLHVEL